MAKYIALDFGAESGRVMIGNVSEKGIELEEIHRFANRQVLVSQSLHWDILHLFFELKKGLSLAAQKYGNEIVSVGVDTWGVDFGLIDRAGNLIGNPYCYRDTRTNGILEEAFKFLPKEKFYSLTGNQFMEINTAFQLLSMVKNQSPFLDIADKMLFMPDLFAYFLTGEKINEYTIASTSQLLNPTDRNWQNVVFSALQIPQILTNPIVHPGTVIGSLQKEILTETGLKQADFVTVGSHDTASAVAAIPAQGENWAYLSSGTWSLMGVESDMPILTQTAFENNFTNEGGVGNKIRFLKNITGMWILQQLKKQWEKEGFTESYADLVVLGTQARPFICLLDVDHPLFANTPNMVETINQYCTNTNQSQPQSRGEYVRVVLESLAFKYRLTLDQIKACTGKSIHCLHVVGGGSQNTLLNQFIANALQIEIKAGPVEATALGNIMMQAIAKKEIDSVEEGRKLIQQSVCPQSYLPENNSQIWEDVYQNHYLILK